MRTLSQDTLNRMEIFVKDYQREHNKSPSYREIMHGIGMSSLNLVQRYVIALERNGRIQRTRIGNIALPKRLRVGENVIAPLVGDIACGQPNFAEEHIEGSYALPVEIFGSGKLFLLRAFGNSMIDAGIEEGDLLVLRQQNYANDGDIVVALTDGGNATLKRFYRHGKKIILHPENKTMKDIVVEECEIQGVLVNSIKSF